MKRTKSQQFTKKVVPKKKKVDPLDRWALEPGFKPNNKACDTQVSSYFTTNTSLSSNLLSVIAQGVGDNQRVGQRVRLHSIRVTGIVSFYPAATGIVQADYLRAIFYYDRQTNGASALWKDIIYNDNTGFSLSLDNPNWYQRGRFKILRDFKIPVPACSATVAMALITNGNVLTVPSPTSAEMKIEFYKDLKGKLDIIYNGTGNAVSQINGGGLFLAIQNLQGTNWWNIDVSTRVEFTDV